MLLNTFRSAVASRQPVPATPADLAPKGAHTASHESPCITFSHLAKHYVTSTGRLDALKDINLSIASGEIFGIIGRSGAGKSTLLRIINRLERANSGVVTVLGQNIDQLDETGLVQLRRRTGMIFQHFNLLSSRTVWQNVALPLQAAHVSPEKISAKVDSLLSLVGLSEKRDVYPAKLSGGQKQRVGIARALVHDPSLLLCDEATSALDPETTQSILSLLRDINRRLGLTVVLITHEMAVIREICDRVAVMESGSIVEAGEVWEVFGAPRHDATRALLQPLTQTEPAAVQQQWIPHDPAGNLTLGDRLLLRVTYTGGSQTTLDFAELAVRVRSAVHLIHGGIDHIQGRPQGRLLIAVTNHVAENADVFLGTLKDLADHVDIVARQAGSASAPSALTAVSDTQDTFATE